MRIENICQHKKTTTFVYYFDDTTVVKFISWLGQVEVAKQRYFDRTKTDDMSLRLEIIYED